MGVLDNMMRIVDLNVKEDACFYPNIKQLSNDVSSFLGNLTSEHISRKLELGFVVEIARDRKFNCF